MERLRCCGRGTLARGAVGVRVPAGQVLACAGQRCRRFAGLALLHSVEAAIRDAPAMPAPMPVPVAASKSLLAVKPGDSFEHWRQVTCRDFSLTECRRVADRRFRARISIREFGPLLINEIASATPGDELIRVARRPLE